MASLSTKKFSKNFSGVRAVNNVDFEIENGKITGLIGPNGSGKSTLINLITGLSTKDSGTLILSDSVKIEHINAHDIKTFGITRTFQNVQVFEQMTVFDNILITLTKRTIFGSLFERHTQIYNDRTNDVLKKIGLIKKKDELAQHLSYGQRKLLEIGRAIATDCNILLFDEPYAGLFPEAVKEVSKILKDLKDENKSIVLIEHNIDLIREMCDYLYVMNAGRILSKGIPEKVLKRKDVIEAYLGE